MNTERVIAFRCPDCGTAIVGDLNLFVLGGKELTLSCKECGSESVLKVKLGADGKLYLTVPCLACPSAHRYCVQTAVVFSRELFVLQCELTGFDLCFIGEAKAVEDALEKNRLELLALSEECEREDEEDDEECEEECDGDCEKNPPLFDPVLTGQMLFLIRELAKDGKISCACGQKEIDFRLLPDGFLFSCPKCGAAKVFPAHSDSDRLRLEELSELKLGEEDGTTV